MIKTIVFYLGTIFSLIICMIVGPIRIKYLSLRGKEKEKEDYIFKMTCKWARLIMKLSFADINVTGLENIKKDETYLFVSNHQSYLDIPLIMGSIDVPKGFIAKKELENWPGISYWMKHMKCIFMDRDNVRKSAESIVEGINTLKSGYSMVIFPEGTRSLGNAPQEFKAGSFKLSTKSHVPIIPITIDGSYKILSGKFHMVKRTNINLTIHEKIDVTSLSKEEITVLPEKVENIVIKDLK